MSKVHRCHWSLNSPEEIKYHDEEWGTPSYDDSYLFEMLILEGAQAGLSWITVLKKREEYRKALFNFNASKIAKFDEKKEKALLENKGLIRNKLKIKSLKKNAQAYLKVKKEFGTFSDYIWQFVNGKPINNNISSFKDIPTQTDKSIAMSKDLKKRGFTFVGPTICYAFMQAVGMVNDHEKKCFCYKNIADKKS